MSTFYSDEFFDYVYKVVLVGESNVGKTNILSRYSKNEFNTSNLATLGFEFSSNTIKIGEKSLRIQIWDTAGQEKYRSLTNSYYHLAKGALVVFDITNSNSYDSVDDWVNNFRQIAGNRVHIILLGNKVDLFEQRVISSEDAQNKAKELSKAECSALNGTNINEAFYNLSEKILEDLIKLESEGDVELNTYENKSISITDSSNNESKNCSC